MRRLAFLVMVTLAACGTRDPAAPVEMTLENLVGYWGGSEVRDTDRMFIEPQVVHVRESYGGVDWYGEAVGYESNFLAGKVELNGDELVMTDFAGHPPVRLQLDQVTSEILTFKSPNLEHTWNLHRQDGCVVPFTMLHEFGAMNPVFLDDGTLVYRWGAMSRRLRPGHCIEESLQLPEGRLAAGPNGELWILENGFTPTREVRVRLHRVTDLDADPPTVQTEVVAETSELTGNEDYGVTDDGTGAPVVVVSRTNRAWKKVGGAWQDIVLPELEPNMVYAWRNGELVGFATPEDPEQGRVSFPYVTKDDVVWGLFIETLNGYHGLIRLARLDDGVWTKWAVGHGQMRGLRVRDSGVVDIAINESLEFANVGFIEATPDADGWLTRHRRVGQADVNGTVDSVPVAFGPQGAMFLQYHLRRPVDERGDRETFIPVSLALGDGISSVTVPALGVSCDESCEFTVADNEAYEVRLDAGAALSEVEPGPATIEQLDATRWTLMVPGNGFRTPVLINLEVK